MPKARVTPLAKILGLAIIAGVVFFGFKYMQSSGLVDKIAPKQAGSTKTTKIAGVSSKDIIKVCVVTWGGYAGGQYFNGGFKASKESRYYKEYGILVEFVLNDDFASSRAAWKTDAVNLQWTTADAYPTETGALKEYDPRIIFQADWSRGGDAIVVTRSINTVSDLRGKKIAVAYGTPSNTFLLWLLDANNMTYKDVELIEVPSAVNAAEMFRAGKVDAAVVWSPDDEDCVAKVNGAKVLKSTKQATHIIADVFYAKKSYIDQNEDKLTKLVEGWMRGAAEINSSEEAKKQAAQILSAGLGQDANFCLKAINNTRLCTFGDNKGFFTINGCNACVTGEQLYAKMTEVYTDFGLIKESVPAWRSVVYTNILRSINLAGVEHEAEGMQTFSKPTQAEATAPAFASKTVSIVFNSGSSTLDVNAQSIIDNQVVPVLKAFGSARVRVEGNTDNVGGIQTNTVLSEKRARAAVDYMVSTWSFDRNRFVEVGNGPNKPVASNDTPEGKAKNRRTEFQLLN
jgi:NitT/TauT family transport system substrate-binding protein